MPMSLKLDSISKANASESSVSKIVNAVSAGGLLLLMTPIMLFNILLAFCFRRPVTHPVIICSALGHRFELTVFTAGFFRECLSLTLVMRGHLAWTGSPVGAFDSSKIQIKTERTIDQPCS